MSDSPITHYTSLYSRLFRFGSWLLAAIVAGGLFWWFWQKGNTQPSSTIDTPPPAADPTNGTVDNNLPTTTGNNQEQKDTDDTVHRRIDFYSNQLLSTLPGRKAIETTYPDETTAIIKGKTTIKESTEDVTITLDHNQGKEMRIIQLSSDYQSVNDKYKTASETPSSNDVLIETFAGLIASHRQLLADCSTIVEQLSTRGDVECNEFFVHVPLISDEFQRSYYFYHSGFALDRIETSDTDETAALSSVTKLHTDPETLVTAIDKLLAKRTPYKQSTPPTTISASEQAQRDFVSKLGITPDAIEEKDGTFGVHFVVDGVSMFGVYEKEQQQIKGLVLKELIVNDRPVSIPSFVLDLADQQAVDSFVQSPREMIETFKTGIKELYKTPK